MSETTEQIILPAHGVDYEMPDTEYHRLPLCSKHALDLIYEYSPMHLQWHREHPPEPTPAMVFGSALHTAVLEPAKFTDVYCVAGQCESVVKASGQRCRNQGIIFAGGGWLCGVHGKGIPNEETGKIAIAQESADAIENIVRAISFNRAASELLAAEGKNEVSAFFTHPVTGTECKMRCDGIRLGWESIFDVKTTENASKREFEKSLTHWRYAAQAAFYQDGLKEVGINTTSFVFIAVEKSAPFGVATYRLQDEAIQAGREEYMQDLKVYAECERTGVWNGYDSEFQDISLSKWKIRELIGSNQF
jgi:hypothetical protein